MAETININKIASQYHSFRAKDLKDGGDDSVVSLSSSSPAKLKKKDLDGDGKITFLEYLPEKYRTHVDVPLQSIETAYPELDTEQHMGLLFKALELGESHYLFFSLCSTYFNVHSELPSEGLQKRLVSVIGERAETDVRKIEDLVAREEITSTAGLDKWLDFCDTHLAGLAPFQKEAVYSFAESLSDVAVGELALLAMQIAEQCQNEYQVEYLLSRELEGAIGAMELLETEKDVLELIQNAGQAEFFKSVYYLRTKKPERYQAILPLIEQLSSREVGGLLASMVDDQFAEWEIAKLVEYIEPLISYLEEKVAAAKTNINQETMNGIAATELVYKEADLNPAESKLLAELEAARHNGVDAVLGVVYEHKKETLPREIAYPGDDQTLASQVNWNEIAGVLFTNHPELREKIIERLEEKLAAADPENKPDEFKKILLSIPCREVLDLVLYDKADNIEPLWREARPLFGHITQGGDKLDYATHLQAALDAQGVAWNEAVPSQAVYVPMTFVDLNDTSTKTSTGLIIPLPEEGKHVLLIENPDEGIWEGRILSSQSSATMLKAFWRRRINTSISDASYFLAYYPKVHVSGDNMTINLEYDSHEKIYEHFCGKITGAQDTEKYQKALAKFEEAYANEDVYFAEQMGELQSHLSGDLVDKVKQEELPTIDDLIALIYKMDDIGGEEHIKESLGVTNEEFQKYENEVAGILAEIEAKANAGQSYEPLSPAAFLAKAIEKCDGRALVAAAISYSFLYKQSGNSSGGNLTTVYPHAFDWEGIDASDKSGAVYHFMGTFFSSYGVQTCLVHRYYTDKDFQVSADKRRDELLDFFAKTDSLDFNDQDQQVKLLSLTQYMLLGKGNIHQKEIFTLSGIFKEEVQEDQDTSNEVFYDTRGMAAGHAFYQMVWGETLTTKGEWTTLNDNRRNAVVDLLANSANPKEMSFGTMVKAGALLFGLAGLDFLKFV
jgi:hypothetical protein